MKKTAVIYARFSSYGQTEQSIEGQLHECYAFAKKNDLLVVGEYIDRAMTGTNDNRPDFKRMIEDSKKKTFNFVLVYQLDRFARNRYDSATYKAKLKKNGVRVISARENITDDASGILVEGMLESMAEYYSAELSQKVKRGIKESLAKGNCLGGMKLFGYDIKDKKWVMDETEADIVRQIFERYKNGDKAKEIVDWLNHSGIRNKQGRPFQLAIIARMIRNEKYIGKFTHEGTVYYNIIPAIVDEKTFKQCNLIMDGYKHKPRDLGKGNRYILSGKLYCGYCGSLMTAESGTSMTGSIYHYYKCFNRKRDKTVCGKKNYPKDELEDLVFAKTKEYVLQKDVIETIAKIVVEKYNEEIEKSSMLQSLQARLRDVEHSISGLMTAIEQGIITKTTKERMIALETEKDEIENNIKLELCKQRQPLKVETVRSFLYYFANEEYKSNDRIKEFFNGLINKVVLYDDKICIYYNTSPETADEVRMTEKKEGSFLNFPPEKDDKFKCNPSKFKRVAFGNN